MKRLHPVPLTSEDWKIMMQEWEGRLWCRPRIHPLGHALAADRRDADLMYQAQEARFNWDRAGWRITYSPMHVGDIAVGGGSFLMNLTS